VRSSTRRTSSSNSYTVRSGSRRGQSTRGSNSSIRSSTDRSRTCDCQASSRTCNRSQTDRASEVERTGQRDRDSRTSGTGIEVDRATGRDGKVPDVRDESCTVSVTTTRAGDSDQIGSRSRRGRSTCPGNGA